jgi:hypothetical protein
MLKDSALYVLWFQFFRNFWSSMQELKIDESDSDFAKIVSLKSQLDTLYAEGHPSKDTANNCPTRQNLQLLVDCLCVMVTEKGTNFCRQNTDWGFVISEFHVLVLERELNPTFNTQLQLERMVTQRVW